MAMLDKVKAALQISVNSFDIELTDLIAAGVIDLNIAGVEGDAISTTTTDAIATRALISYVAYHFELVHGALDRANALKIAYDEQKAQLSMATGYTDWGTGDT